MYHSFSFFCWQYPWFYLVSLQILWQVIQILRVNRNIESILFFFLIFYVLQAARNNVLLAVPALLYAINNYLKFIMQVKVLTITNFSYHSRYWGLYSKLSDFGSKWWILFLNIFWCYKVILFNKKKLPPYIFLVVLVRVKMHVFLIPILWFILPLTSFLQPIGPIIG